MQIQYFSRWWLPFVGVKSVLVSAIALKPSAFPERATKAFAVVLPMSLLFASVAPAATLLAQATPVLYVSPTGNDAIARGNEQAPFKTITAALKLAQPNTVIAIAPGRYSQETGEVFPLQLKPGVTVQGSALDRGQFTLIVGSGRYLSAAGAQEVAIVGAPGISLIGVTLSNPSGIGLWMESGRAIVRDNTVTSNRQSGIVILGNSTAQIQNNFFWQNSTQGLLIAGTAAPEVQGNIFEQTGVAVTIAQSARPQLVGNRVTQNQDGIVIREQAQPVLRQNSVEGNQRDGLVVVDQAQPVLSGNWLRYNSRYDLNTTAATRAIATASNEVLKQSGQVAVSPPVSPRSAASAIAPLSMTTTGKSSGISAASFPVPATAPVPQPAPPMQIVNFIAPPSAAPPLKPLIPSRPPQAPPIAIPVSSPGATSSGVPSSQSPARLAVLKPIATVTVLPPGVRPQGLPPLKRFPPIPPPVQPKPAPAAATPVSLPPRQPIANDSVTRFRNAAGSGAIPIPVPPPESRASTPAEPPRLARTTSKPDLLPVPGAAVPIGEVGKSPTVNIYRRPPTQTEPLPDQPLIQAAASNGRYRVVIEASDDRQPPQIAALAAFRTFLNGRLIWQVGAFSDRALANDLVQQLKQQGVTAAIETLE